MTENVTDNTELLLWMDLETSGSKWWAKPLEVAWCVTELNPRYPVLGYGTELIRPNVNRDVLFRSMPEIVQQMHTDNGLLDDLYNQHNDVYIDARHADLGIAQGIAELLHSYGYGSDQPFTLQLAGSGVSHFDSLLIREQFPTIWRSIKGFEDSDFLKPTYDIGIVRRFLKSHGIIIPIEDLKPLYNTTVNLNHPHRALYDVFSAIEQARWVGERLAGITF